MEMAANAPKMCLKGSGVSHHVIDDVMHVHPELLESPKAWARSTTANDIVI